MPIHKRDRNFQNIVRELEIKSIPTEFIQQLSLVCENGDRITFDGESLNEFDNGDLVLTLIQLVEDNDDLESNVCDVEIIIDYKKLEIDIAERTNKLLRKDDPS